MKQSDQNPIIVVGGGLGGVATALGLGRRGKAVCLLEQSAEIAPIGYGVQLGPNVLPALAQLGLEREVRMASYYPEELTLYEAFSGEVLARVPLCGAAFDGRYPAPYIAIHRVDLHEILLKACRALPNVSLNQATTVTGFTQDAERVYVESSTGQKLEGSALIAADGLRSRIRAQLYPEDQPYDTGYIAHRTIVAMADVPPLMRKRRGVTMWTGPGFHVIYYPLRDATEMNIVAVFETPTDGSEMNDEGYSKHIARVCADAQPEVKEVVSIVNLERRWSIADRHPIRKWRRGLVVLLGDSAHATLQSLAQGAGMAIEDAVTLSGLIDEHGSDYEQAFGRFETLRFGRTTRVQLESRALWHTYHCDGVDAEIRTQQLQERTPEDFYRCLDWLWKSQPFNHSKENS
ncbi:FAD-dependent monooxygenase [Cupriavidus basilensis]|uniref:FAD-dependent monooxygenase n=1 Tax=Cupriavidus basilensis TaxID=68895 RepID=UPI00069889E3|nr:FAD-dependent monooxygenase [Cupriavidus basilensis]